MLRPFFFSPSFILFLTMIPFLQACSQNVPKTGIEGQIQGEWVEYRQEMRNGFVFQNGLTWSIPSISLSFKGNKGTFYNPNVPEPEYNDKFYVKDSTIYFGRKYEIVKLKEDTMVLILSSRSFPSENDCRSYFVRKNKYDQLNLTQKLALAVPSEKDYVHYDTSSKSRWNYEKTDIDKIPFDVRPSYEYGIDSLNRLLYNTFDFHAGLANGFYITIDETGKITDFESESQDTEHEKQIKQILPVLSHWKPATYQGKPVKYRMALYMYRK